MTSRDTAEDPGPFASEDRISVGIGEYALTTDGVVLATSGLGSCVGVLLRDDEVGVAGLLHVMLPAADDGHENPAKYADTGIEALLAAMVDRGADRSRITARIAGGSDMLDIDSFDQGVGERNVSAVREVLAAHDVSVVGEDVGGDHGRSLEYRPDRDELVVRTASAGTRTV